MSDEIRNPDQHLTLRWIKTGAICGLLTTVIYPVLLLVKLPLLLTVILAVSMGLLLATGSIGLYHITKIFRKTVTLQLAVLFNILAGTLLNMMFMVQLTVRQYMGAYLNSATNDYSKEMILQVWKGVDKVQLGLDISWDSYIAVGTFLFALNLFRHPRFGVWFGGSGMIISVLLLALNYYSFPIPPAETGLIDVGPAVGLWYAATSIQALRSLEWARNTLFKKSA